MSNRLERIQPVVDQRPRQLGSVSRYAEYNPVRCRETAVRRSRPMEPAGAFHFCFQAMATLDLRWLAHRRCIVSKRSVLKYLQGFRRDI